MKTIVLGGAAAGANAGNGCSGYLVRAGPTIVVVDLGPDTVQELKRHIDVRNLTGIVISHMHLDHILDLITLRGALRYAPVPFERPIPLHLPPGGRAILDSMSVALDFEHHSPLFFDQTFDVSEYNPLDSLQIGHVSIDFAPTFHPTPCFAMRLMQAGLPGTVGYTADTGPVIHLASFFSRVDALICEATLLEEDAPALDRVHLTATEAGLLASAAGARRLLLTHTWDELGVENLLRAAQESYAGPVEVAWAGLEIEV